MRNWIVVGDAEVCGKIEECLIRVCYSKESAEKEVERMLTNPTEQHKRELARHSNIRVKYTGSEPQWWDDPFLAN